MRQIICFLLLIFGQIPSEAFAQNEFQNEWTSCDKNSDCIWFEGTCSKPVAINKSFLTEYQAYLYSSKNFLPGKLKLESLIRLFSTKIHVL